MNIRTNRWNENCPTFDSKQYFVLQILQRERTYSEISDLLEEYLYGISGLSYGRDITNVVSRLRKKGLVERTNPDEPKSKGYRHRITEEGREVLRLWNEGFDALGTSSLA